VGRSGISDKPNRVDALLALFMALTWPVEYVIGGKALGGAHRETATQLLADDPMKIACGGSPGLDHWRARRDGRAGADRR
jgi:hypothetical protein